MSSQAPSNFHQHDPATGLTPLMSAPAVAPSVSIPAAAAPAAEQGPRRPAQATPPKKGPAHAGPMTGLKKAPGTAKSPKKLPAGDFFLVAGRWKAPATAGPAAPPKMASSAEKGLVAVVPLSAPSQPVRAEDEKISTSVSAAQERRRSWCISDHPVRQYLEERRQHSYNELEPKNGLPRYRLKQRLVLYLLEVLHEMTKDSLNADGTWTLHSLPKTPAQVSELGSIQINLDILKTRLHTEKETKLLALLAAKSTFSLDEALNFHRNALGKGDTTSYTFFRTKEAPATDRDRVVEFLEQTRTRILNKKISRGMQEKTSTKLKLLSESIIKLKAQDPAISLPEIANLKINNVIAGGDDLSSTLVDVLQIGRNGTKKTNVKSYKDFKKNFPEAFPDAIAMENVRKK
jgi:hypothetical protein